MGWERVRVRAGRSLKSVFLCGNGSSRWSTCLPKYNWLGSHIYVTCQNTIGLPSLWPLYHIIHMTTHFKIHSLPLFKKRVKWWTFQLNVTPFAERQKTSPAPMKRLILLGDNTVWALFSFAGWKTLLLGHTVSWGSISGTKHKQKTTTFLWVARYGQKCSYLITIPVRAFPYQHENCTVECLYFGSLFVSLLASPYPIAGIIQDRKLCTINEVLQGVVAGS